MYQIYTYGGGEVLIYVFNAINTFMGSGGFGNLLKLVGVLGIIIVLFQALFANRLRINFQWLFLFVFIYVALFVPKVTVQITDRLDPATGGPVANTPIGLALFASTISQIGDGLTQDFDTLFALPGDLQYSQTGMLLGSRYIDSLQHMTLYNALDNQNLQSFIQECVFPDIAAGKYTWQQLDGSGDLYSFWSSNTGGFNTMDWVDASGTTSIIPCIAGIALLKTELPNEVSAIATQEGQKFFSYPTSAADMTAFENASTDVLSEYAPNIAATGPQLIEQAVAMNEVQRAISDAAAKDNATAAVVDIANAKAQVQRNSLYVVASQQAARILPLLHTAVEAILYAIFPIALLLMLLPGGGQTLSAYVFGLLWMQLWYPLYAVLNLLMTLYGANASHIAVYDPNNAAQILNLTTEAGFTGINAEMSVLAGYLSMSVPIIAFYIASRSLNALSGVMNTIISTTTRSSAPAADALATGNLTLGHTNVAQDATYGAHLKNEVLTNGATLHTYANGSQSIDTHSIIDNTASKIDMKGSVVTSLKHSLTAARAATTETGNAFVQSGAKYLDHLHQEAMSNASSTSSGHSYNQGATFSNNTAASKMEQLTAKYARDQHISYNAAATQLLDVGLQGYAGIGESGGGGGEEGEGGMGGNIGVKGGLAKGYNLRQITEKGNNASAAHAFVTQHNYMRLMQESLQSAQATNASDSNLVSKTGSQADTFDAKQTESDLKNFRESLSSEVRAARSLDYAQQHAGDYTTDYTHNFDTWAMQKLGISTRKELALYAPTHKAEMDELRGRYINERTAGLVQQITEEANKTRTPGGFGEEAVNSVHSANTSTIQKRENESKGKINGRTIKTEQENNHNPPTQPSANGYSETRTDAEKGIGTGVVSIFKAGVNSKNKGLGVAINPVRKQIRDTHITPPTVNAVAKVVAHDVENKAKEEWEELKKEW